MAHFYIFSHCQDIANLNLLRAVSNFAEKWQLDKTGNSGDESAAFENELSVLMA